MESDYGIDKALYWEQDCGLNIVDYMNKYLGKCNVFVIFCTENAQKSKSVKAEWEAAFQLMQNEKLSIIPVYENSDHIPPLLLPLRRVRFDPDNLEQFVSELSNEILKTI